MLSPSVPTHPLNTFTGLGHREANGVIMTKPVDTLQNDRASVEGNTAEDKLSL